MIAAANSNAPVVRTLVQLGADVGRLRADEFTPRQIAEASGHTEITALLDHGLSS